MEKDYDLEAQARRAKGFVAQSRRTAVFMDNDADGFCAGAVVHRALARMGKKPVVWRHVTTKRYLTKPVVDAFLEECADLLFVVDVATVDGDPDGEFSRFVEAGHRTVILDHHQVYRDWNGENVVMYKPQMGGDENPSHYPVAKLALDFFAKMTRTEDLDWLAAAGLCGDMSYPRWKAFVDGVIEKYGDTVRENVFETDVGMVSRIIYAIGNLQRKKIDELYALLLRAKNPREVVESPFREFVDWLDQEQEWKEKEFDQFAEHYEKQGLYWWRFESEHDLRSYMSTILSQRDPNGVYVVIQDFDGEMVRFSVRHQGKRVHAGKMIEYATKDLEEAGGGGHPQAAAGSCRKHDVQTVKERMLAFIDRKGST